MNKLGLLLSLVLLLAACSDGEFERMRHRAEVNERIRIHCIPLGSERIMIQWTASGDLQCQRYTPAMYRASVVVKTVTVATSEEINQ